MFWLITGSALGVRDGGWLRGHAHRFSDVEIRDVTSSFGVINLAGPLARFVLGKATDADVSPKSHSFMTAREINIGYAPAVAFRVTYIGELGWELYIPVEYMQHAYEVLADVGAEFGITDIGYRAIDSLRLEKRFLVWGADITPDDNPIEAGLGFVIDWKKGDFLGAKSLARVEADGPARRLVYLGLRNHCQCLALRRSLSMGKPSGRPPAATSDIRSIGVWCSVTCRPRRRPPTPSRSRALADALLLSASLGPPTILTAVRSLS